MRRAANNATRRLPFRGLGLSGSRAADMMCAYGARGLSTPHVLEMSVVVLGAARSRDERESCIAARLVPQPAGRATSHARWAFTYCVDSSHDGLTEGRRVTNSHRRSESAR